MVKGDSFPISGLVAGGAIGAEFAAMLIVLLMTGVAIGRCAFVTVGHMAFFTPGLGVRTLEFECGQVVVERCGLPAIDAMTRGAVRTEPARMWLIFLVTGIAISGNFRKVGNRARVGMTF